MMCECLTIVITVITITITIAGAYSVLLRGTGEYAPEPRFQLLLVRLFGKRILFEFVSVIKCF
jgi:hypothetical protein